MPIDLADPSSLRTVHLTNYFHENSGGISTSYNELMDAAERHGRSLRLIVPGERDDVVDVGEHARIYYVRSMRSPVFDRRYRLIMPWQYMPTRSRIKEILVAERPDVIEVTDKYTISMMGAMIRTGWFKKLDRPVLVHFSCERMDDNIHAFIGGRRFAKWVSRNVFSLYLLPSFDFHVANSEYTAEEMINARSDRSAIGRWLTRLTTKLLNGSESRDNIYICPRGVDVEKFPPGKADPEFRAKLIAENGFPTNAKLLVYAGRISNEKNVWLLADMMEQIANQGREDIRLAIAGAGPLDKALEKKLSKAHPGACAFLGHISRERLAAVIANADVFVHPNPREPFGIGPLEAMASGVPVVAPNAGGILTYANTENAWLASPDGEGFADAVIQVLADSELRNAKIAAALETAAEFTSDKAADRQLAVYEDMYRKFTSTSLENKPQGSTIFRQNHSMT